MQVAAPKFSGIYLLNQTGSTRLDRVVLTPKDTLGDEDVVGVFHEGPHQPMQFFVVGRSRAAASLTRTMSGAVIGVERPAGLPSDRVRHIAAVLANPANLHKPSAVHQLLNAFAPKGQQVTLRRQTMPNGYDAQVRLEKTLAVDVPRVLPVALLEAAENPIKDAEGAYHLLAIQHLAQGLKTSDIKLKGPFKKEERRFTQGLPVGARAFMQPLWA